MNSYKEALDIALSKFMSFEFTATRIVNLINVDDLRLINGD